MNKIKRFNQFVNESKTPIAVFTKGDLVYCKDEGETGLVGLIVSDEKDGMFDVYFRGYNGDILELEESDMEEITLGNVYLLEDKADLRMYKSIASKQKLKINADKYEKLIEELELEEMYESAKSNKDDDKADDKDDDIIEFKNEFCVWFTGTSLCTVKHPEFGKHQLTIQQMIFSKGEYKNKLYKNIQKCIENGDLTKADVKKHSSKK